MKDIKKLMITLVALLAVTTGAWAEEKMVTINSSTTSSGAVTTTGFNTYENYLYVNKNPATITTSEGVITKLVIKKYNGTYGHNLTEANVGVTPGTITYGSDEITVTDINAESVTLSRKGGSNWSTSSVDVYYDAPSGPTVAWDKAKKTGTFTMPGGNVELEPEYYPQAALTAQPTAINDVPATTDGAIVKAGTVANIGSTTTAQGTVMYYVSTTALDDAALLALAADQWTADVPTAESLAQGQAYVYYYVRGNDSDTDEENFSDGDILAANALTVTIAAAPTYAVTFADDLAEPTLWTASPNTGVTKGQTVTVTYTGTKKVLGVKAEKKAAAPATVDLDASTKAWADGSAFAVPAGGLTYSDAITVSGDVTLVLTDGETLTLNKGISLAEGATLTIQGNGTMNVNGSNGNTSSTVAGTGTLVLTSGTLTAKGGNGASTPDYSEEYTGADGGVAINGAVTVAGGALTATGGNGGNVGKFSDDSKGGAGGAAIKGALTINGGTVTTTNGNFGSVGSGSYGSSAGTGGAAVAGTVTDNRN